MLQTTPRAVSRVPSPLRKTRTARPNPRTANRPRASRRKASLNQFLPSPNPARNRSLNQRLNPSRRPRPRSLTRICLTLPSPVTCAMARSAACLENPFLAFDRAEGADVGHRERHSELAFVAGPHGETVVLHAQAAAIGVIGYLGLR